MDEERLKQAARFAAEILAQAKVTAARASQTLDRGRQTGTVAAAALSRARRAEVWAEAAIGRSREVDHARGPSRTEPGAPPEGTPPRDDQIWRADALAWLRAARAQGDAAGGDRPAPPATTPEARG